MGTPRRRGLGQRARVRTVTDVVAGGAGAVDLDDVGQPGVGDELRHHRLGGRRSADVAEAHEADPDHADPILAQSEERSRLRPRHPPRIVGPPHHGEPSRRTRSAGPIGPGSQLHAACTRRRRSDSPGRARAASLPAGAAGAEHRRHRDRPGAQQQPAPLPPQRLGPVAVGRAQRVDPPGGHHRSPGHPPPTDRSGPARVVDQLGVVDEEQSRLGAVPAGWGADNAAASSSSAASVLDPVEPRARATAAGSGRPRGRSDRRAAPAPRGVRARTSDPTAPARPPAGARLGAAPRGTRRGSGRRCRSAATRSAALAGGSDRRQAWPGQVLGSHRAGSRSTGGASGAAASAGHGATARATACAGHRRPRSAPRGRSRRRQPDRPAGRRSRRDAARATRRRPDRPTGRPGARSPHRDGQWQGARPVQVAATTTPAAGPSTSTRSSRSAISPPSRSATTAAMPPGRRRPGGPAPRRRRGRTVQPAHQPVEEPRHPFVVGSVDHGAHVGQVRQCHRRAPPSTT